MENHRRQCPFLKQECISKRCEIFLEIPIRLPGVLAGTARTGVVQSCSLNLIAKYLANLHAILSQPEPPRSES